MLANVGLSKAQIVSTLRERFPGLLAVYLFGSRSQGSARRDSDLDLAALAEGKADPVFLWMLAQEVAELAGCEVDLLDLRAASTVMQYQIVTTGIRLWARDVQAGLYECMILSEKTELDEARAGLLADIRREGRVYGSDRH